MNLSKLFKRSPEQIKIFLITLVCSTVCADYCNGQNPLTFESRVTGRMPAHPDELRTYPDSFVYLFKPKILTKPEHEAIPAVLFRIKLPTGMLRSYSSGFDSFGFLYPGKQVIYVYMDRYSSNIRDTAYYTSNDDEINLLLGELNTINTEDKLDAGNNPLDNSRSSWIIKKGKATILLYNIQKDNISLFRNYANTITFL